MIRAPFAVFTTPVSRFEASRTMFHVPLALPPYVPQYTLTAVPPVDTVHCPLVPPGPLKLPENTPFVAV